MKKEISELEKIVVEIQEAGQAWIEAKLKSDQLEDNEKNFLAAIMNRTEAEIIKMSAEKASDTKLERWARGSNEFLAHVKAKNEAKAETGKLKVRYEALQAYWEAQRSQLAFEREKIAKGIFHEGRG